MRELNSRDRELLAWVSSRLQQAQREGVTGEVRVQLHEGVVQRVRQESVESAPKVDGER